MGRVESGKSLLERILKTRREAWQEAELAKMHARGKPPQDERWKEKYSEPKAPNTTELPKLPDGWVWVTLDQLIVRIEAGKNIRCEERPPVGNECGLVKISAVTWGAFDELQSKTIIDRTLCNEKLLIRPGDFLFSRANTIELVGASVIVRNITKHLMISDKVFGSYSGQM